MGISVMMCIAKNITWVMCIAKNKTLVMCIAKNKTWVMCIAKNKTWVIIWLYLTWSDVLLEQHFCLYLRAVGFTQVKLGKILDIETYLDVWFRQVKRRWLISLVSPSINCWSNNMKAVTWSLLMTLSVIC